MSVWESQRDWTDMHMDEGEEEIERTTKRRKRYPPSLFPPYRTDNSPPQQIECRDPMGLRLSLILESKAWEMPKQTMASFGG